jgi:tristetraprolin
MPSSPVDYRKQLDRSVSEPVGNKDLCSSRQDSVNSKGQNINSSHYKTELCRPFEENGYCKYGDKCQIAHGFQELRSLNRHPKYKTELCRTYHTIGFCPYGPRCHFVHNDEERRAAQQQQQQAALQSLKQQQLQQNPSTSPVSPSHQQFSAGRPNQMAPVAQHPSLQQQHHLRPKSLNFNLIQMQRDSLGSTADSPPSSVTDSPTLSPTFLR